MTRVEEMELLGHLGQGMWQSSVGGCIGLSVHWLHGVRFVLARQLWREISKCNS